MGGPGPRALPWAVPFRSFGAQEPPQERLLESSPALILEPPQEAAGCSHGLQPVDLGGKEGQPPQGAAEDPPQPRDLPAIPARTRACPREGGPPAGATEPTDGQRVTTSRVAPLPRHGVHHGCWGVSRPEPPGRLRGSLVQAEEAPCALGAHRQSASPLHSPVELSKSSWRGEPAAARTRSHLSLHPTNRSPPRFVRRKKRGKSRLDGYQRTYVEKRSGRVPGGPPGATPKLVWACRAREVPRKGSVQSAGRSTSPC
jgi:hypothetical protein